MWHMRFCREWNDNDLEVRVVLLFHNSRVGGNCTVHTNGGNSRVVQSTNLLLASLVNPRTAHTAVPRRHAHTCAGMQSPVLHTLQTRNKINKSQQISKSLYPLLVN